MRPLARTRHSGVIILKWILKEMEGWGWSRFRGSRYGQVAGCCEEGNEPSGEILTYLKTC
jgi:hypothetical protein